MALLVVHVFGVMDRGGAESVALDLCRQVPAAEVHQILVTLSGRKGSMAELFEDTGAEVEPLPLRPLLTFPLRWVIFLSRVRPDVVVSHVSLPSAFLLLLARLAGVRVRVARLHSEGDGRVATRPRRVLRAALRVTFVGAATEILGVTRAACLFGTGGLRALDARTRVLPNGVDLEKFHPERSQSLRSDLQLSERDFLVLHVGRAALEKNRRFLLGVSWYLVDKTSTVLLLVGPGGSADLNLDNVDLSALPRLVIFGERDDIPRLMQSADVLVLPSTREGLPGVVFEALACGTPVIATDLPGLREVQKNLQGLTLIALAAGPVYWAAAIDASRRTTPSQRANIRASFERSPFGLTASVDQWRAVWQGRR